MLKSLKKEKQKEDFSCYDCNSSDFDNLNIYKVKRINHKSAVQKKMIFCSNCAINRVKRDYTLVLIDPFSNIFEHFFDLDVSGLY